MTIPTLIYIEFYLILKKKFIEKIPAVKRVQVQQTKYNFWYAKAENSDLRLFKLLFSPETPNPKFFYNKYLDALNYPTIPIEEKDGIIIHVVEKVFELALPEEIEKPGDLFFDERAQVLFQVLFEQKSSTFYKDNLAQLKVFDRETKKFNFKKIRTDNRVLDLDASFLLSISPYDQNMDGNSELENPLKIEVNYDTENEYSALHNGVKTLETNDKIIISVHDERKEISEFVKKYFDSLLKSEFNIIQEFWHPEIQDERFKYTLTDFLGDSILVPFESIVVNVENIGKEIDDDDFRYCIVYCERFISINSGERLNEFSDFSIDQINEFVIKLTLFTKDAERLGIKGLGKKKIKSLFDFSDLSFLVDPEGKKNYSWLIPGASYFKANLQVSVVLKKHENKWLVYDVQRLPMNNSTVIHWNSF